MKDKSATAGKEAGLVNWQVSELSPASTSEIILPSALHLGPSFSPDLPACFGNQHI